MRLVQHRNRNEQRRRGLRIAISQAEITADLHYPATRQVRQEAGAQRAAGR